MLPPTPAKGTQLINVIVIIINLKKVVFIIVGLNPQFSYPGTLAKACIWQSLNL